MILGAFALAAPGTRDAWTRGMNTIDRMVSLAKIANARPLTLANLDPFQRAHGPAFALARIALVLRTVGDAS